MPLENLNGLHYTAAEKTTVNTALNSLMTALSAKFKNLLPEERSRYGSVNEQNKLLINKVKDFRNSQPAMSSPDVDWVEFQNDCDSREFLESAITRLEALVGSLKNNKTLHDYDCYHAALTDYDYSKYKAGSKTAGYEVKVKELAQFFPRTNTAKTAEDPAL
ncbi:hypothetical protein ACFFLS_24440 [Flavobacterium procerum]|uniref:Uncharacterized protein n=1 Tax=Flavobacterium procerum TaxID=1455569 RepID=A0ABV6C029_9FLAO